jgi:four helix bundle protein
MSASKIRDYKDLLVWQKGIALAKEVYKVTRIFPSEEKFGLISQMRRAAVSVPSNIAEGQARNTRGEFIQFLSHAEGSLAELDTQARISIQLGFGPPEKISVLLPQILELQKMLKSLRAKLTP